MEDQKPVRPDFMKKYYEGRDEWGQARLDVVAQQYERARQEYMQNVYPQKAAFLTDWNKKQRQSIRLDPDDAVRHIREEYNDTAKKIAIEHGYVEPEEEPKQEERPERHKTKQVKADKHRDGEKVQQRHKESPTRQKEKQPEPSRREKFMQNMDDMRQRQQQKQTQQQAQAKPPQAETGPRPSGQGSEEQPGKREQFMAALKDITQKDILQTQTPKP